MRLCRGRVCALGALLLLYLTATILLSAVTFYEPRSTPKPSGSFGTSPRSRPSPGSFDVGLGGLRTAMRRARLNWCAGLRFLEPPRYPTALVSFPGSGNTWLRYLLQQATGIYTGSVYKDYGLLKNGFPAESVVNGSVLVVKTHEWGAHARSAFSKAVLLIRAPGPAIQAEFNRQSGGHIGFASPDRYKRTKGKYWAQFVQDKLSAWKETNLDWLYNFTGPTHVLFYEKLVENVEVTLKALLEFLEMAVPSKNLSCALERKEGIYRRRKRILNFDPYTTQMKKMLKDEEDKVYKAVKQVVGNGIYPKR